MAVFGLAADIQRKFVLLFSALSVAAACSGQIPSEVPIYVTDSIYDSDKQDSDLVLNYIVRHNSPD